MGPGDQRLGNVARIANAPVGYQRNAGTFQRGSHVSDGGDLRYPHPGDNTGGTDRTRPDTDLDRVRPGLG